MDEPEEFTEEEYYEGLFEHRRQVQEIYDAPTVSFPAFLVICVWLGGIAWAAIHWGGR